MDQNFFGYPESDDSFRHLRQAEAPEYSAGISRYEYSYQRACECHPDQEADTIVTVANGRVVGVRYAREGYSEEVALPPEKLSWYRTIDDLFSLVETAQANAETVRVEFDTKLGYPVSIYVDYVGEFVGDELGIEVTGFAPAD